VPTSDRSEEGIVRLDLAEVAAALLIDFEGFRLELRTERVAIINAVGRR